MKRPGPFIVRVIPMRETFATLSAVAVLILSAAAAWAGSAPPADPAETRVESILGKMTLEEKIDLLGGVDFFYLRGVPRLGVPRLRMADGPYGVRNDGPATTFASGIGLAASWNPALAERVGTEFGRDARGKGVHFLLAPGVNIYRAPIAGRNFEYFGEDPLLAGRIAVGFIKGVQSQGVSATVKHFAANNTEYDRNHTDSIVDERTLREIYLPAFEAAVKDAQVGAIMDAYNLTNGAYMSQNGYLNNDLAKKEWGFQGVMMSDWISTYDGVGAANGGLDVEMPSGEHLNRETLLPAIQAGKLSVATIDDKVRRILRTAVRFGWLDREAVDLSIPRFNQRGREAALQNARESMVLLKNEGGLLPFGSQVKSILLVGPNAYPAVLGGGGSSQMQPFTSVSFLEGLSARAGAQAQVYHSRGIPSLSEMVRATELRTAAEGGERGVRAEYFANAKLEGASFLDRVEPRIEVGSSARPDFPEGTKSARWTGYYTARSAGAHDIFVGTGGDLGGLFRLSVDDRVVLDDWTDNKALLEYVTMTLDAGPHKIVLEHHGRPKWPPTRVELGISRQGGRVDPQAVALAAKADVVVVAAGFDPSTEAESADRTFRLPPAQVELIQAMAAANKNTVVVATSGGNFDMQEWLDRVPALIEAWYAGQEGGTALAEILFGDTNPSGRLPATFEKRLEDNPAFRNHYPEPGTRRIRYEEGVFVGYRGYEKSGVTPQFPFGYGLSYTTFKYGGLALTPERTTDGNVVVSFDVTNTGPRAGKDVAQVYLAEVRPKLPRPPKELKGFVKVSLEPGETQRVSVTLDRRSFSYYDVATKQWRADAGVFEVLVGRSSVELPLKGSLTLAEK
jgi:beta-glucosidase